MPFKFQWLCELLEELQNNRCQRATTTARSQNPDHRTILSWFNKHDHKIERNGRSAVAFLSSIFPERRVDRVFNLQEKRLSPLFGRALGLGSSRAAELNGWRERDGDDFPTCVERVMHQCEFDLPPTGREVTLEEIDAALHQIAANSPFSSPAVKARADDRTAEDLLRPILQRLRSSEAKWLIRLMFKSFGSFQIPERFTMKQFHFMLPDLLVVQNSLDAAVKVLAKSTVSVLPPRPNRQYEQALRPLIAREITPVLGIMIRRQPYHKARSIKHCCNITNKRQMSVERKYDGEYCQIHIDMSKGRDCLQIFSKSGKDSTNDRLRLHGAIKDGLRLDMNGCKIRDRCVIEGELLVWSSSKKEILPFHTIRKHVRHGGRYIGTAQDSPAKPDEELMIVYYDLLMLDGKLLLNEPLTTRRQHLKALVKTVEGRSIVGERRIIDFNSTRASQKLREAFAHSITHCWEGLVLKACDEAFFCLKSSNHGIKLKKDYIAGLGDSADFCLVGGRRDARVEQEIGLGPLRWTSFHIGCLTNKEEVIRYGTKPHIKIIDELTTHSMPDSELVDLNRLGRLLETPFSVSIQEYDVEIGHKSQRGPSELFRQPFVVEVMGAGYERLSNSSFYTLRFPRKIDRKVKILTDRSLIDTVSFAELQRLAKDSLNVPEAPHSQEDAEWIERLIRADGKVRNTQNTSQSTSSTRTPRSAATMSISPVYRRKEDVPLLYVRADTEDRETPDRESFASTTQSLASPLAGSETQQSLQARQTTSAAPGTSVPDIPRLQPNTSDTALPPGEGHSRVNDHACSHKRRRQPLDYLGFEQSENKRRRLDLSHANKMSDNESQVRSTVFIDLTSPTTQILIERRPLTAIYNPVTPSTTRIEIDLISPMCVEHSAIAADSSSQIVVSDPGTICPSVPKNSVQAVVKTSFPVNESQNHSSANIGRRRIAKSVLPTANTSAARQIASGDGEPRFLATPFPSSALAAGSRVAAESSRQDENDVEIQHATTSPSSTEGSGRLSFKLAPAMFISDSLYNLKAKQQKGLNAMLQGLRSSVTFSVEHFLDHVDNGIASATLEQRSLHVMLINFRDIEGAKKDVEEIFEHLIFRARRAPPPRSTEIDLEQRLLKSYSNLILVFDYKVLTKCEDGELNMDILKALKDTNEGATIFGGIIKIDNRRLKLGREPKYLLLTDWSWAG